MISEEKHRQKIAKNRNRAQKIDQIDCDFFPNEKIDLNGSIRITDQIDVAKKRHSRGISIECKTSYNNRELWWPKISTKLKPVSI